MDVELRHPEQRAEVAIVLGWLAPPRETSIEEVGRRLAVRASHRRPHVVHGHRLVALWAQDQLPVCDAHQQWLARICGAADPF
jgi:hypothetical protein